MKAHDPHLPPGEHHQWGLHTPIAVYHEPKRPTGVSIAAGMFLVMAGFFALAVILAFVPFTPGQDMLGTSTSAGYSAFSGTTQDPQAGAGTWGADVATQAAIAFVLAVVFATLGFGLWRLRLWARIAAIIMPAAIVVLLLLTSPVQPFLGGLLVLLALFGALAVYLMMGNVAAAFRGSGRERASVQVQ